MDDTAHTIDRLAQQVFALRVPLLAHRAAFAALGIDVDTKLAQAEALLVIASMKTAAQHDARTTSVKETVARATILDGLVASKEAVLMLARLANVPTSPFEVRFSKGTKPIESALRLREAMRTHGDTLGEPRVFETLLADVERDTEALLASERETESKRAASITTTREKQLAKSALYRMVRDLSRYGQIVFRHDRAMKRTFSLSLLKPKPTRASATTTPPTPTAEEGHDVDETTVVTQPDDGDETIAEPTPSVIVPAIATVVEAAVIN